LKPLAYANLALLILYPVSWFAPLATAGIMPFFGGDEISVISGLQSLWESDVALALAVALFAVVAPILKTAALSLVQFDMLKPSALPAIELIGKLAMADVFLIAIYIMLTKGIGIGRVEPAWGLWLFTACVLGSVAIGHLTHRRLAGH
jgi:uncharacterized paraquat-inducible protein A